jgi:hypothetical protein
VENLWMSGEYLVDVSTREFFFIARVRKTRETTLCVRVSWLASLVCRCAMRRIVASKQSVFLPTTVPSAVHRFEESIGGRPYLIEVAAVSDDRWRAYIVRLPGVPTALMPFYGATPVEAAHQLCEWLARAHARSANPAGSV